jgi:hypothetical protein
LIVVSSIDPAVHEHMATKKCFKFDTDLSGTKEYFSNFKFLTMIVQLSLEA